MLSIEEDPAARLAAVRDKLARAAALARRAAADIALIAVSKTHPADAIVPLIAAGQRSFGENRVQEAQKGGCAIGDLPGLLAHCRALGLTIAGLMCVPPADTEAAPYFALLARLAKDNGLSGLSMGMSGDYETAAMLGATCVRVGTALFGSR